MKVTAAYFSLIATTAITFAAFVGSATPESGKNGGGNAASTQAFPAPTNLKVLPREMTGAQVREVMRQWTDALGTDCSACHVRDPKDLAPNGQPRFNYADDSREEKGIARVMYTMLEDINTNYVAKIESSGMPVTCGTCHRGSLRPDPFVAEDKDEGNKKGREPSSR